MQTSNDAGFVRTVLIACLLILAVSMIALGVSATTQRDFSRLPRIVYETVRAALANVQRSS